MLRVEASLCGVPTVPLTPWYHLNVAPGSEATTLKEAEPPTGVTTLCGGVVMFTVSQLRTVTVAVRDCVSHWPLLALTKKSVVAVSGGVVNCGALLFDIATPTPSTTLYQVYDTAPAGGVMLRVAVFPERMACGLAGSLLLIDGPTHTWNPAKSIVYGRGIPDGSAPYVSATSSAPCCPCTTTLTRPVG